MENVLTKIIVNINDNSIIDDIYDELNKSLEKYDNIFSYLIYCVKDAYRIQICISSIDEYNTYNKQDIISYIVEDIISKEPNSDNILSWKQPPLDITVACFEPLVCKLSKQQAEAWNVFEYDDLCQMCRLCIVRLSKKGYYINPKLITRTFINDVLMALHKNRCDNTIVSLDTPFTGKSDDKDLLIQDIIVDDKQLEEEYDKDIRDANLSIMNELKDIIIDIIGPRGYDQLLKEYGNKQTTAWGAKTMNELKYKLKQKGYTKEKYNKYYGG